jgi:hypothetical protein
MLLVMSEPQNLSWRSSDEKNVAPAGIWSPAVQYPDQSVTLFTDLLLLMLHSSSRFTDSK